VTLSDDINEFMAIVSFKNHLQNELGLITKNPVDITQYSREDFLSYYVDKYDPNNPTQYDQALAQLPSITQATQQVAEKHEAEMKELSADAPNLMTTTLLGKLPIPTLQIQNLYGLRKDRIDCSSNRLDMGINTYMEGEGDINGEKVYFVLNGDVPPAVSNAFGGDGMFVS